MEQAVLGHLAFPKQSSVFCTEGSMKSRLSKPLLNFYTFLYPAVVRPKAWRPSWLTDEEKLLPCPALPSHAMLFPQEAAILCQPGAAEALEDRKLQPRLVWWHRPLAPCPQCVPKWIWSGAGSRSSGKHREVINAGTGGNSHQSDKEGNIVRSHKSWAPGDSRQKSL